MLNRIALVWRIVENTEGPKAGKREVISILSAAVLAGITLGGTFASASGGGAALGAQPCPQSVPEPQGSAPPILFGRGSIVLDKRKALAPGVYIARDFDLGKEHIRAVTDVCIVKLEAKEDTETKTPDQPLELDDVIGFCVLDGKRGDMLSWEMIGWCRGISERD